MPRFLLATILAAGLLALVATPAAGSRSQFTFFEASAMVLDGAHRDATLDEIDALGADALRIVMYWRDVAPGPDERTKPDFDERDPASYPALEAYAAAIEGARERGLRVLLTVSGPVPRWATARKRDHVTWPSRERYRRFVAAVAKRLGDDVTWWSLWNEPNQSSFLKPQRRRGRQYSGRLWRQLYFAGRRGLRDAGLRDARILLGDTGPRGATDPIPFLRQALCLNGNWRRRKGCSRIKAHGWAHHPHSSRAGPWRVPRNRNQVTMGSLSRLVRALNRAARGRAINRMPVYLTEFGVQSHPDKLFGVPQWRQAQNIAWAELKAYRTPRVRSFSQYLMRDDEPRWNLSKTKRYSGFESGLKTWDGERKAAYDAFRTPLVAQRRNRRWARLWGHVRPAEGRTRVALQYRNKGSKRWRLLKRVRTNRRGYFSTTTRRRSGRRWRVEWRDSEGNRHVGPSVGVTPKA